jgi:hypothetical protein
MPIHIAPVTDTSIEAEAIQLRILRAMPPGRRLALATGWSGSLRSMIRAKLHDDNRGATPAQLHRLFADRWLGPELAAAVYDPSNTNG